MIGDRGFRLLAEGASLPPLDLTQYEPMEWVDLSGVANQLTANNPDLESGAGEAEFDCS